MTRLISGLAMAGAAVAAILFVPLIGLRLLATMVAGLAAYEYLSLTGQRRGAIQWLVVALVMWACWATAGMALPSLFALVGITLGWLALSVLYGNRRIHDAASDLMAPVYIGVPLGMLVAGQALGGWRATLVLLGTVVVSDSAQYYAGRRFGRRPLAPAISPKKTVEGALGGVVFGILFMTVAGALAFRDLAFPARALLGAIVVMLGIAGDLFESRLKRAAGIKDSSSLIPGHGGVLNRIDALLFAIPAFYYVPVRTAL